jgi:multiple sugar transport system ATP-binding protein
VARLDLANLSKAFKGVSALNDLSLTVNDREFFVLLGPTGAGKTTTLRCIAGLERADRGTIEIDAQEVGAWSAAQRDVALVFQHYSLYPHYSVRENLAFPLQSKLRNMPAHEIETRVRSVAQRLRIEHLLERKTERLSGGEMQRVSIGRAIVREPKLFLMDEPLSNLDAKLREVLRAELKDLQINLGATFLFVTHDQIEAMTMGDRIGVLQRGRLIQVGTPFEIYNRPKNTFVATFVGSPAINLLDAVIENDRIAIVPDQLTFALTLEMAERLRGHSGPVRLGVRAEDVVLESAGGMLGQVYGVENHGAEQIVTIKIEGNPIRAAVPAHVGVAIDELVGFEFNQTKLHFFARDSGENLLYN